MFSSRVQPRRPDREQHQVGHDALARFERDRGAPRLAVRDLDALDGLAEAEGHVGAAHLVDQLVDDLAIEELERTVALVDQRHLHAERREHRRVLDADDAAADDGQRPRQGLQIADLIAGDDD